MHLFTRCFFFYHFLFVLAFLPFYIQSMCHLNSYAVPLNCFCKLCAGVAAAAARAAAKYAKILAALSKVKSSFISLVVEVDFLLHIRLYTIAKYKGTGLCSVCNTTCSLSQLVYFSLLQKLQYPPVCMLILYLQSIILYTTVEPSVNL